MIPSTIIFLAAGVAGHMIMNSPPTYDPSKVTTSPLSPDAGGPYPFPCQMGPSADYTSSNATEVQAGNSVPLRFTGSAVHGGGSCQISLFALAGGKKPTGDPNEWKVIHSIIGGCPATTAGNLEGEGAPSDAYGRPDSYECKTANSTDCKKFYSVPTDKNLPSGDYVWAWTWFNHIGNQEMYMNCAPIKVTGGSSNSAYLDGLPSIFAANIPGTCKVYEGERIIDFPNPGPSVERSPFQQDAAPSPANALGTCSSASSSNSSPASGSNSSPGPSSSSAPTSSSTSPPASLGSSQSTSTPAPAASPSSNPPPVIVPINPDSPPTTPQATSATPGLAATDAPEAQSTTSLSASPSTAPPAPAGPAPAVGSSCKNPCPTDGAVVCFPPNSFGLCDHGCAVVQPLAAGTSCSNGVIEKRRVHCEHCRFRHRNHTHHNHANATLVRTT